MIPVLHTERLTLRGPRRADFESIADVFASGPAGHAGGADPHREARNPFTTLVARRELCDHGLWSVEQTATGILIGMVGLCDPEDRSAPEIGFWLAAAEFGGRGNPREAGLAVRRYARETAGWGATFGVVAPECAASIRRGGPLGTGLDRSAGAEDGGCAPDFRHPGPEVLQ